MRYVPYHRLGDTPHIVVDGAANAATVLTLSHWPRSGTPADLRADLSAQIAFRYLDTPARHVAVEAVSNNHFDEDGLVSLFVLTQPEHAQPRRQRLIDVAGAGDFGTATDRDAARAAFAIAACADPERSPLPAEVWTRTYPEQTEALYEALLPRLPEMADHPERFASLWEEDDRALAAGEAALRTGRAAIEEHPSVDLAVVTLPEGESLHDMALYNATRRFRVLLLAGRRYELRFRYETWVQYVSFRPLPRVDLAPLAAALSEEDDGRWEFPGVDEIAPRLQRSDRGPSRIGPGDMTRRVLAFLAAAPPAWDPFG
jgi:hypothetical protein